MVLVIFIYYKHGIWKLIAFLYPFEKFAGLCNNDPSNITTLQCDKLGLHVDICFIHLYESS